MVCLVVTEVVQQFLTVHITVSNKTNLSAQRSLPSPRLPAQVAAVEMSPEFLSKAHAWPGPALTAGAEVEPTDEELPQSVAVIFKTRLCNIRYINRGD